jgi:hypothetical protein
MRHTQGFVGSSSGVLDLCEQGLLASVISWDKHTGYHEA